MSNENAHLMKMSQSFIIFTPTFKKRQMTLLNDKTVLREVPEKQKFAQILSHTDRNELYDTKDSVGVR